MNRGQTIQNSQIDVRKTKPNAEYPFLNDDNKIGFEVVLIGRTDDRVDDTVNEICMFDTGIIFSPVSNSYAFLIADVELMQKGYTILSPILIENDTDEPISVPLFKFRDAPDLELPCKGVKLVLFNPIVPVIIPTDRNQTQQPIQQSQPTNRQQPVPQQSEQTYKSTKKTVRNYMS
jgi:hypothetical protein